MFIHLALVLQLAAGSCVSLRTPAEPRAPDPGGARIRIGSEQYGQVVSARTGDTLVLEVGAGRSDGILEFDREVIEAAGAEEPTASTPGGLLFRCIATGRTELTLTLPGPRCPAGNPCPPANFEFRTTVDVKPKNDASK